MSEVVKLLRKYCSHQAGWRGPWKSEQRNLIMQREYLFSGEHKHTYEHYECKCTTYRSLRVNRFFLSRKVVSSTLNMLLLSLGHLEKQKQEHKHKLIPQFSIKSNNLDSHDQVNNFSRTPSLFFSYAFPMSSSSRNLCRLIAAICEPHRYLSTSTTLNATSYRSHQLANRQATHSSRSPELSEEREHEEQEELHEVMEKQCQQSKNDFVDISSKVNLCEQGEGKRKITDLRMVRSNRKNATKHEAKGKNSCGKLFTNKGADSNRSERNVSKESNSERIQKMYGRPEKKKNLMKLLQVHKVLRHNHVTLQKDKTVFTSFCELALKALQESDIFELLTHERETEVRQHETLTSSLDLTEDEANIFDDKCKCVVSDNDRNTKSKISSSTSNNIINNTRSENIKFDSINSNNYNSNNYEKIMNNRNKIREVLLINAEDWPIQNNSVQLVECINDNNLTSLPHQVKLTKQESCNTHLPIEKMPEERCQRTKGKMSCEEAHYNNSNSNSSSSSSSSSSNSKNIKLPPLTLHCSRQRQWCVDVPIHGFNIFEKELELINVPLSDRNKLMSNVDVPLSLTEEMLLNQRQEKKNKYLSEMFTDLNRELASVQYGTNVDAETINEEAENLHEDLEEKELLMREYDRLRLQNCSDEQVVSELANTESMNEVLLSGNNNSNICCTSSSATVNNSSITSSEMSNKSTTSNTLQNNLNTSSYKEETEEYLRFPPSWLSFTYNGENNGSSELYKFVVTQLSNNTKSKSSSTDKDSKEREMYVLLEEQVDKLVPPFLRLHRIMHLVKPSSSVDVQSVRAVFQLLQTFLYFKEIKEEKFIEECITCVGEYRHYHHHHQQHQWEQQMSQSLLQQNNQPRRSKVMNAEMESLSTIDNTTQRKEREYNVYYLTGTKFITYQRLFREVVHDLSTLEHEGDMNTLSTMHLFHEERKQLPKGHLNQWEYLEFIIKNGCTMQSISDSSSKEHNKNISANTDSNSSNDGDDDTDHDKGNTTHILGEGTSSVSSNINMATLEKLKEKVWMTLKYKDEVDDLLRKVTMITTIPLSYNTINTLRKTSRRENDGAVDENLIIDNSADNTHKRIICNGNDKKNSNDINHSNKNAYGKEQIDCRHRYETEELTANVNNIHVIDVWIQLLTHYLIVYMPLLSMEDRALLMKSFMKPWYSKHNYFHFLAWYGYLELHNLIAHEHLTNPIPTLSFFSEYLTLPAWKYLNKTQKAMLGSISKLNCFNFEWIKFAPIADNFVVRQLEQYFGKLANVDAEFHALKFLKEYGIEEWENKKSNNNNNKNSDSNTNINTHSSLNRTSTKMENSNDDNIASLLNYRHDIDNNNNNNNNNNDDDDDDDNDNDDERNVHGKYWRQLVQCNIDLKTFFVKDRMLHWNEFFMYELALIYLICWSNYMKRSNLEDSNGIGTNKLHSTINKENNINDNRNANCQIEQSNTRAISNSNIVNSERWALLNATRSQEVFSKKSTRKVCMKVAAIAASIDICQRIKYGTSIPFCTNWIERSYSAYDAKTKSEKIQKSYSSRPKLHTHALTLLINNRWYPLILFKTVYYNVLYSYRATPETLLTSRYGQLLFEYWMSYVQAIMEEITLLPSVRARIERLNISLEDKEHFKLRAKRIIERSVLPMMSDSKTAGLIYKHIVCHIQTLPTEWKRKNASLHSTPHSKTIPILAAAAAAVNDAAKEENNVSTIVVNLTGSVEFVAEYKELIRAAYAASIILRSIELEKLFYYDKYEEINKYVVQRGKELGALFTNCLEQFIKEWSWVVLDDNVIRECKEMWPKVNEALPDEATFKLESHERSDLLQMEKILYTFFFNADNKEQLMKWLQSRLHTSHSNVNSATSESLVKSSNTANTEEEQEEEEEECDTSKLSDSQHHYVMYHPIIQEWYKAHERVESKPATSANARPLQEQCWDLYNALNELTRYADNNNTSYDNSIANTHSNNSRNNDINNNNTVLMTLLSPFTTAEVTVLVHVLYDAYFKHGRVRDKVNYRIDGQGSSDVFAFIARGAVLSTAHKRQYNFDESSKANNVVSEEEEPQQEQSPQQEQQQQQEHEQKIHYNKRNSRESANNREHKKGNIEHINQQTSPTATTSTTRSFSVVDCMKILTIEEAKKHMRSAKHLIRRAIHSNVK